MSKLFLRAKAATAFSAS